MKNNNSSTSHPTVIRFRRRFPDCSAKTLAGLYRYAKAHAKPVTCPIVEGCAIEQHQKYRFGRERYYSDARITREAQAERKNPVYRKRLYSRFTLISKTTQRVTALTEEYNLLRSKGRTPKQVNYTGVKVIPLSRADYEWLAKRGLKASRIGKEWNIRATYGRTVQHSNPGSTEWKNGKPVSYTRAEHVLCVRSFALICKGIAKVAFDKEDYSLVAPSGYAWAIDANGLNLGDSNGNEYHPSAKELLDARGDGCATLIALLQAAKDQRELAKVRAKAELANEEGVFVCLADSLRSGNCRTGSLAFASRVGLDPRRHIPAQTLLEKALAVAPDSLARVRLAISAAILRHKRELKQGFGLLAEHFAT